MSEAVQKINNEAQVAGAMASLRTWVEWGLRQYGRVEVAVRQERRTLDQNAKLWPMLTDISRQVTWYGLTFSPEEWKDLATGTFRKAKVVPNLDNTGFVTVGMSTSKMTKGEFSEFIEYLYAFGAERDVRWGEKSREVYEEFRRAA